MSLRDYQQNLYDKVQLAFLDGKRRPLVVAPCGAGKSYIFMEMAKHCPGIVRILTHRRELQEQHKTLAKELGIFNVEVEMVITEYHHMLEHQKPKLLILDEAHLSTTNTWIAIVNHYDTFTIGFTATPVRLDGKPLGAIFDCLIQDVSTRWLIEHKYLAPFKYYAPLSIDVSGARINNGDFVVPDLERIMSDRAVYGDVIDSVQTLCPAHHQIIAYCVSLKHAEQVCAQFVDAGITAQTITSKMAPSKREEIMRLFRFGFIRVLCNVGIISEGVSLDNVYSCLLLRPTMSHALYWQQAMRCLRYKPNKKAVILDFVGNYTRNPLPDEEVVWKLDRAPEKKSRLTEDGDFTVRVCPECYRTFKTASTCPYCGKEYPLQQLEIIAHEKIKLAEIAEEERMRVQQEKKRLRQEVGRAQSYPELLRIAHERGYKPAWARMVWNGRKR